MANTVMQTLPCSSCNRLMVLQPEVSTEAVVRCPQCGDRFVVADLVQRYVGKWEVISDPQAAYFRGDTEQTSENQKMQSPDPKLDDAQPSKSQPSESHDLIAQNAIPEVEEIQIADHICEVECIETNASAEELAHHEHQSDLELVHEESESLSSQPARTMDWSKFEPLMPSRNDRRRRRQSSILTIIPTVLGGLAAMPIALLLIWFVLGTDPMKLAPTVARYVPWLVPNKLLDTDDHLNVIARLPESAIPKPGESGFRRFDDVLPPTSIEKNSQREPSPVSTASAEERLQTSSPLLTAITEHDDETEGTPVVVLLNRVQSGLNAWRGRTADKAEHRKIAKDLYSNLSELSVATTKRTVPALQSIGASVLQQDDVCDLINQGARHWFAKRNTETVGMAICCEVQKSKKSMDNG